MRPYEDECVELRFPKVYVVVSFGVRVERCHSTQLADLCSRSSACSSGKTPGGIPSQHQTAIRVQRCVCNVYIYITRYALTTYTRIGSFNLIIGKCLRLQKKQRNSRELQHYVILRLSPAVAVVIIMIAVDVMIMCLEVLLLAVEVVLL